MARHTNCAGVTRRDGLKLGLAGLCGGSFVNALRWRSASATETPTGKRPASCILVWMDGGPSHYETFDPKPEAPSEIRGEAAPIATKLPGVFFAEYMERLASIADKLAIVRSIRHNDPNHGGGNHYMMTGAPTRIPVACGAFVSFHPSFGSAVAALRSGNSELPGYVSIPQVSRSGGPSFLGAKYAPFVITGNPNSSSFRVRDVTLPEGLADARFATRREIRERVDTLKRIADKAAGDPAFAFDEYYRQGYSLITSTAAQKAFDIHSEPSEVRERYGRNSFGQQALLARRLVEAGVPFVTLYQGGWDDHVNLFKNFQQKMPRFEGTIAALIEDLEARGLLDSTLVVVLGEFGRTPKINKDSGRDHWASAMSVLFAGAGCPRGIVVGATDNNGYAARDRILSPENFASTIYRKLGIDPAQFLRSPEGRPVQLVSNPTPIAELMA